MHIKTEEIAVFTVSDFDACARAFWLAPLDRILERYPLLEHPHRQSFYMLIYTADAAGCIRIDERNISLEAEKVICTSPNSITSIDINRNAKGWILIFTEDFFSLRYNENVLYQFSFLKDSTACQLRLTDAASRKWAFLLETMSGECTNNLRGAEGVLRSYLNILLSEVERSFVPLVQKEHRSEKEKKAVQFEQLLEHSFNGQKLPSWYAAQLNISTNYLNRICREYRGHSSGDMIRKRITIEAQRLLHYTYLSVSEVAYKLGFESVSYFATFFKKNTGISPDIFRKMNG
jgi:AraC family transcriptional activator of pobA